MTPEISVKQKALDSSDEISLASLLKSDHSVVYSIMCGGKVTDRVSLASVPGSLL